MALYEMLIAHRGDLLERWNEWVRNEVATPDLGTGELVDSMPVFIDELIAALAPGSDLRREGHSGARSSARVHGGERLRLGFDVTAVVREYNLLRRAIFELVQAKQQAVPLDEIQLASEIIEAAQAEAVAEYQRKRDQEQTRQAAQHLSFLAHELRTPLSATLNAFSLARGHVAAEASRYVAVIDRGVKRLMDVLDNALVAGRVQTGVLPQLADIDLCKCVREVVAESELNAEHRGMILNVELPPSLSLHADARLLHSVLSNLVGNAIKFSQPGSVIAIRAHQVNATTVVEVEDACGGLPDDKVTAIFDPHVQIGGDRSGFGLGLAIAKQAAEAHSGTLQVQNLESRGCCFRLELPGKA